MASKKSEAAARVFKAAGDIRRNVQLDWFRDETPYAMPEAFKDAADGVVERALASPEHPDRYFYPIAYLYRHFLELQLKNLIAIGRRLLRTAAAGEQVFGHDLDFLWKQAKDVILKIWPEGDACELEPAEEVINAFHHIDRTGEAFRYYQDKGGHVLLADAPTQISLDHLRGVMDDVYRFLSGCECGMREYLSNCNDAEYYR